MVLMFMNRILMVIPGLLCLFASWWMVNEAWSCPYGMSAVWAVILCAVFIAFFLFVSLRAERSHSNSSVAWKLLFASVLLVTLFSCCSWLYPNNPWDDSNVFMSIGKSMKHGMLLYRDIFDQKEVALFLIHQMACYVSEHSFLGIYLLEIICFWGFLMYSYRIMRLFTENAITLPLTIFWGTLFIASDFFWYGDSVEELSLPILSYSLFHILRFVKDNQVPKVWQSFLLGVGIGVIFWMKYTLLTFYAGALMGMVIVACRKKQLALLCKPLVWIFAGLLSVTTLVVAYFIYHGTLSEMLDAYFYTNIFQYHGSASNGEPAGIWFKFVKLAICAILILPVAITKVRRDVKLPVLCAYSFQLLSYALLTLHLYYFIPLFVYAPLVVYFLRNHRATRLTYVSMAGIVLLAAVTNFNIVSLLSGRFQNTVVKCAEIINEDSSANKKVLTFCSRDTGIYLLTDQLPPNKFFFVPNLILPDIRDNQAQTIEQGDIKYLIRKDDKNKNVVPFYETEVPDDYELIFHGQEVFRHRFLINPLMFLWNLGYTQPLLKGIVEPEREYQDMLLYRKRQ